MKPLTLTLLKFAALLFLLPGLGALVLNATLSTRDYASMPTEADPDTGRVVPRIVHDRTIFITESQNRQLSFLHHYGSWAFVIGIGLGFLYLGSLAFQLEKSYVAGGDEEQPQ